MIKPLNKYIIVEKNERARKRDDGNMFKTLPTNDGNLGVVKYSDDDSLQVGTVLYFANKHERFTLEGAEVYAMKADNVIAISEEPIDDTNEKK